MLQKKFWLRILNVDQGEWWVVKRLFFLQFLQGAGIAFFFTAALGTFLGRFEITELPWVMLVSSVLLWTCGFLYNRAEHHLSLSKLVVGTTVLMAVSGLLFRVLLDKNGNGYLVYLMLAWFNVLYLLNNLQFWGIATLLFDLRQSKRLFGLISSGDIPAKFIGYSMASVILERFRIDDLNLLYFSFAFILASIPVYLLIARSGQIRHPEHKKEHHAAELSVHHGAHKVRRLVENFIGNKFIRDIALISFLAFVCLLMIDFGFYSEIKHRKDQNLTLFIATFMAVVRLAALVVKIIFTGRLTASMGVRNLLLITPVVMMIMVAMNLVPQNFAGQETAVFYIFGATAILIDVCRTVFNSPVLLSIMQPLPTHERLRAHNIVKGIMDPFAYLCTGLILLSLTRFQHKVDLITLCYVLLGIGIVWILGVFLVNRQYLNILIQTISHRYFSQEEFSLNDESVLSQIRNKIRTGTDLEVISILKMLYTKKDPVADDLIAELLLHPSPQVKMETLRLISGKSGDQIKQSLRLLLGDNTDPALRYEAITALCKTGTLDDGIRHYLEESDEATTRSAICGMLLNPDGHIRHIGEEKLARLIQSGSRLEKLFAAHILQQVRDEYDHPLMHLLISDPDMQVQSMAIKSVGRAALLSTVTALLDALPQHTKQVINALQNTGENTVDCIETAIASGKYGAWTERFIILLGRIGGEKAKAQLIRLLNTDTEHLPAVIKSLYRIKYQADEAGQARLEALARENIIYGVELLHMQRLLGQAKEFELLERSIHLEIQEMRDILLCLFSCMYDRVKMNQVRRGLDSHVNENIANAMEIIELTVKKDVGRYFNNMFETTSIDHRCDTLRFLLKEIGFEKVEHIVARILTERPIHYQNWTKACSMYLSKKTRHLPDMALIRKYATAESRLVRETAEFALANP